MLELCTRAGSCLLLRAAKQFNPDSSQQLGLAGFGGQTIGAAVQELLAAKRAGNRRAVYLRSLGYYLTRFAAGRETRPLADFSVADVEAWLNQFPSAGYRSTWLNRVSTLFAFAVRRDFILKNPCDKIERITVDRAAPKILSPEQVEILLRVTPGVCRAYVVLGTFAGIRPDEMLKMSWSDVNLETRTVTVNDAKTRRRRIVSLEPRAVALLAGCPLQRGAVAPSNSTVRRFKRRAVAALGLAAWPKDLLRHTAASYLLALHGDAGKVATMLGNSSAVLLRHYHEPVVNGDCGHFWEIKPAGEVSPVGAGHGETRLSAGVAPQEIPHD